MSRQSMQSPQHRDGQKSALVSVVVLPEEGVAVPVRVVQVNLIACCAHMPPHPAPSAYLPYLQVLHSRRKRFENIIVTSIGCCACVE